MHYSCQNNELNRIHYLDSQQLIKWIDYLCWLH